MGRIKRGKGEKTDSISGHGRGGEKMLILFLDM